jgi:hypothetical protein
MDMHLIRLKTKSMIGIRELVCIIALEYIRKPTINVADQRSRPVHSGPVNKH